MRDTLYTIGYEGADIGRFIAALRAAGVALLIDVRDAPVSRKRDFAKAALERHLAAAGIAYRHLKSLGNPKAGRDAAKAGDAAGYKRIFEAHMAGDAAQAGVAQAAELALAQPACLLCLERNPNHCHRLIVAERIAERSGLRIEHLLVPENPGQGSLF